MPRRLLPSLLLLASLGLPSPAAAWTYGDTLTVIWRPLPNLPSFVQPGGLLTVWANAPATASDWAATLRLGALDFALAPAGGGWQSSRGRWELLFRLPQEMPEELFDLTLDCSVCAADTARHAVKVLPAFKTDFYFAQVTDTHLPTAMLSSDHLETTDTTGQANFDAVIEDLNLIHPEFILHTGDLVNEGELEEYLDMFEMGRAQELLYRLRDPLFLTSGNHDIGGWKETDPPDGTSRKNWWRYFGWPFLANPPAGEHHSQDYSFDYGLVHCIGLEAYINNGSYDSYMPEIWGAQSFSAEQLSWLAADIAGVPAGHSKLLFYHYDFGGTRPDGGPGWGPQIDPAALGVNGAVWGHYHGVPEGNLAARPFALGLQSVIDNGAGGRTFRIFRVHNGAIAPGPMHHAGIAADSLSVSFSGPNDGSRARLSATVANLFGETWEHARLVFLLADHDSVFTGTGGTVAQTIRDNGVASVYVDCVLPAGGSRTVAVAPTDAVGGVPAEPATLRLAPPSPNPFHPATDLLSLTYSVPVAGTVRIGIYDLGGRRVAGLLDGRVTAGAHPLSWNGRTDAGEPATPGLYLVRLQAAGREVQRKVALVR